MDKLLSFKRLPVYVFSANRQFEPGEKHITRIYGKSVLLLIRKGVLNFEEDGKPISLHEGEYYIQRPNLLQKGIIPSESPNYYFIHFDGYFSKGGSLPLRGKFNVEETQIILNKFDNLKVSDENLEKEAIFCELLLSLKRQLSDETIAEKIRLYIIQNLSGNVSLSAIAKHFFFSKNQVINIFKKKYDITPHQFITKERINNSIELIISTNKPLTEIATLVGFSDYSNFYKNFLIEIGISPVEYKKRISTIKRKKEAT